MNITIISAGAGSGKTYRLVNDLFKHLQNGVNPAGVIAATFTNKAAAELQQRVQTKLLEEGLFSVADELNNALIGTVHGLGVKLLQRFAFEAGVSPQVEILAEEDAQKMFNASMAQILQPEKIENLNRLGKALGFFKRDKEYDWRKDIKTVVDLARANNFDREILEKSKRLSIETFGDFLEKPDGSRMENNYFWLKELLKTTIEDLESGADKTKVTLEAVTEMKRFVADVQFNQFLPWHDWAKLTKIAVAKKSVEAMTDLHEFVRTHLAFPQFHEDISGFIESVFDLAVDAMTEFERYKKQRGLIDYTDMETHIDRLLDHPKVGEALREELELLLVDEFQDTSPLQLEIFLKLSRMAKIAIWVGDPKQSIYGFRGADPKIMKAIVDKMGVRKENILSESYRSRADLVHAANSIFTRAFSFSSQLPEEQIVLNPVRIEPERDLDPMDLTHLPMVHWDFCREDGSNKTSKGWIENCIARSIVQLLESSPLVSVKGTPEWRKAVPGDIAVLCRRNDECVQVAQALERAGVKAAIAGAGLMKTSEIRLITACLRYMLNRGDSLAVAEILTLGLRRSLTEVLEDRLSFLDSNGGDGFDWKWAADQPFIAQLNEFRLRTAELSPTEIVNALVEELDLRRIIAAYGAAHKRLENVDMLRRYAVEYEESCNRTHTAASLSGLLLRLRELSDDGKDLQSAGESPDAVYVTTYHKSKGLEFPIVVCHSLESKMRDDVFGVSVVLERDEVDLEAVLAYRWIRYWINPYSDQIGKTLLEEKVDQSIAKALAKKRALDEDVRLLYVGFTRARDYLILPTTKNPARWLNRVWHNGNDDLPILEAGDESSFEWKGNYLPKNYTSFTYPVDFTTAAVEPADFPFFQKRSGRQEHKPYKIHLDKEHFLQPNQYRILEPEQYTEPLHVRTTDLISLMTKALGVFFVADEVADPVDQRLTMAGAIIRRFKAEDGAEASDFVERTDRFFQKYGSRIAGADLERRYPVRSHPFGRLFETVVDFVWRSDKEILVLINHNSLVSDIQKLKQEARKQADCLNFVRMALESIFQVKRIYTGVHFPLEGKVVFLEF